MTTRHRHLTSDLLWSGSSFALRGIVSVVVFAALARLLEPEDFGIATVTVVLGNLVAYVARLGLGAGLVQAHHPTEGQIQTVLRLSVVSAFVAFTFFFFGALLATDLLAIPHRPIVASYGLAVFSLVLVSVPEGLALRAARFAKMAKVEATAALAGSVLVTLGCAIVWGDFRAILVGATATHALTAIGMLSIAWGDGLANRAAPSPVGQIIRFGRWFTAVRVLNYATKDVDNIFLGGAVGAAAVGVYSRAYSLASMPPNYIGAAVERVFFPLFSAEFHAEGRPVERMLRTMEIALGVGLAVAALLCTNAFDVVRLVLGDGWDAVAIPLAILSSVLSWRVAYKFADAYAKATGEVKKRAGREAFVLSALLLGCFSFAGRGATAVAVVVAGSILLNFGLAYSQAANHAGIPFSSVLRVHLRPAIIAVLCLIGMSAVRHTLPQGDELPLIALRLGSSMALGTVAVAGVFRGLPAPEIVT